MKKKLHKLHVQEVPFEVVAIVCPENHLKMSWLLNQTLGYDFREKEGFTVEQQDSQLLFPTHRDDKFLLTLIKNRFEGKILIKSLSNIDFLLKIDGLHSAAEIKKIIKSIKTVPGVLGTMLLETKKVKELTLLQGI